MAVHSNKMRYFLYVAERCRSAISCQPSYLQPNTRRMPRQKQELQKEPSRASDSPHASSHLSSHLSSHRSLHRFMQDAPLLEQVRRSVWRSATIPQLQFVSLNSAEFLASLLKPQHIIFFPHLHFCVDIPTPTVYEGNYIWCKHMRRA